MLNKKRNRALLNFFSFLLIVAALNLAGSFWFFRWDLTSEKRYTLSDATKRILKNLDDVIYFRVFLEGEFPAGFKRLRKETREMLNEFRAYSKNIQFEFINPSESSDAEERNDTYLLLMEKGLNPTDLQVKTQAGLEQQIIFPGALVTYRDKELPVELLESQMNIPPERVLNVSVQNLEFNLINTIRKLVQSRKPRVVFLEGQGELSEQEVYSLTQVLQNEYNVGRMEINGQISALLEREEKTTDEGSDVRIRPKFEALIVAKPTRPFTDKDKFIIDQYIMYGGKVLWMIDPVLASMDSIQNSEMTMAVDLETRLEDMLFHYGVRLNRDVLLDLNALHIPLTTGQIGGQPQIDFFPWYYFPIITPRSEHPIARNLNALKTEFVSSLTLVDKNEIDQTVLLTSSPYTKVSNTPAIISLAMTREPLEESSFNKGEQIVSVLLEGQFESLFNNRIPPEIEENKLIGFRSQSLPTAMIVVSDGDMAKNQFHYRQGYALPLGYDQYTQQSFGNKDFIMNALNYLTEPDNLIEIRSRQLTLRLLDRARLQDERLMWQLINVLAPVVIVLLAAIIIPGMRKRKYTR